VATIVFAARAMAEVAMTSSKLELIGVLMSFY